MAMVTGITENLTNTPIGAVLVVGGGIAGMQASLDLADQGFKVYLVERQSAIGGKMAQLDKTFPTNDCAMCTISPRLVDTGRHPNIQILTQAEVMDVVGQSGNFTVRVQQQPRYVDVDKCVACGDCTKVCPVEVPDRFNEGLIHKRAITKLYPQAVPNAFSIDKLGIAPCRDACPSGQRVQGYIALIREGRWEEAYRVIKMDNPFPGICGRICNHRCETACNRGLVDEPINIRALKRFIVDKIHEQPRQPVQQALRQYPEQVAIIGAGPCGLTAAQDLLNVGYGVTIFEAMPVAGGMLRLGVPEYRLPTQIIEREVQDIIDLGVDLRLNHRIDNLDDVFAEGYHAVLIAVGAHEGIRLPIPGANLEGVLVNTHFLRDVRLGKYTQESPESRILGEHILVLGGGNVAIDCARTAVRLGKKVDLACLESRDKMLAHVWEIDSAEAEGVILHPGLSFEEILGNSHDRVNGVACTRVESFSFDEQGQLHLDKVPGSRAVLPCDTVIFSVGQRAGLAFIPDDAGVGITGRRTIAVNPNTLAATRQGVFAAGDSVSGTAFVIEAVNSGHTAARSIIRYLQGEHLEPPRKPPLPVVKFDRDEIDRRLAAGEVHLHKRVPMPELPVEQRVQNFVEVEGGYDDASAQLEASRCLACGLCSECMTCVFACGANAIDHDMPPKEIKLDVGSIILAPGFQIYQAEQAQEYGFGRYPNVINAIQLERLLSASGPTQGIIRCPSDERIPHRIAFLQCIGSRDQEHDYCSSVCCMYATKEAMMAKEHHPELDIHIYLMDMRAFSKGYWQYYQRAKEQYGIYYHRCRISTLREDPSTHQLMIKAIDEQGAVTQDNFDLVVLSVGMQIPTEVRALGTRLGIDLDSYGFCLTGKGNALETSRSGIFAIGPFREPKDIPESIVEASGACSAVAEILHSARFTLTTQEDYPAEIDVRGQSPRVGVFVCHCGSNIAGFLDVSEITQYATQLPHVVHAERNLYTCSQDSIRHIRDVILEKSLNRVVVASCTPLTHQSLFQSCLRSAGLNPFLFEMANIRNQCSWVHSNDKEGATHKAKDLVRMAVARAALLEPQHMLDMPVQQSALVIGGGPGGMTAACSLAQQGFPVDLVEKEDRLGGNLHHIYSEFSSRKQAGEPSNPQQTLQKMVTQTMHHPLVKVHLGAHITHVEGSVGNFKSTLRYVDGRISSITHGITVLATGAEEYRGPEYGLGQNLRVLTMQEFESWLAGKDQTRQIDIQEINSIAMILCVGPAESYCSRICCTVAIKNALAFKATKPAAQVVILYKDIRTYGFKESLYTQAREKGIIFLRYDDDHLPQIHFIDSLKLSAWDAALHKTIAIQPGLLVLAMPLVPNESSKKIAGLFKTPVDSFGFYAEAHVKLRPIDSSTDGVFFAGSAHYPKLLEETIIQAQAAAGRAARILSQETMTVGGRVAVVNPELCTGCLTCVRICPFKVPLIQVNLKGVGGIQGAAYIEPSTCHGCGSCAAECPARAIQVMHYTDLQMSAKVQALQSMPDDLFSPGFIPVIGSSYQDGNG
jgi:heterodisulfide reductase subunit A-like polyferredoxin